MNHADPVLGAETPIGIWLDSPAGSPVITAFAERAGLSPERLRSLRNIPLRRLLTGSVGDDGEAVVTQLVEAANGGVSPEDTAVTRGWQEPILPGRFDGKTVIVTGAASGIGRATALRLAREGGAVVAVDLSSERLDEFSATHPDLDIRPVGADITDIDSIDRIVHAADGRIDGLANVAGMMDDFSALHEVSDEVLRRVFDVNVIGLIRLTRAVIPFMLEAKAGAIVNVASEAAVRGSAAGLAYTASKSALLGVTRSLAFMYEPHGIRANTVAPGGTVTGMRVAPLDGFGSRRVQDFTVPVPLALPEHLASPITYLLSDESQNVTGALLMADAGGSVF